MVTVTARRAGVRQQTATLLVRALLTLLLCIPSGEARSDQFHLEDGRVIEGSIVREVGDLVSIRDLEGKVVTIDRDQITKTVKKETPLDQYRNRLSNLEDDDLAGQIEIANWCTSVKLNSEALKHWKVVIRLDPDHDQGRRVLGYVWIGGDWYISGSQEAKKRQADLELDPATPPHEIPEDLRLPDWNREKPVDLPDLPPLPTQGVDRVVVIADEKLGKKAPERSGAPYHLARMGGKIQFVPGTDDGKVPVIVKIKIRCYFVKLQTFYGAPVANIFQGEATAKFFQRNDKGELVLRKTTSVRIPFSSSAQRPKDKALLYTYYMTLDSIAARVSRWGWMKQRGSRSLPIPDTP